ncbi:MAG: M28 family peptidase [Pyrinomonadaceae bacterium]
MKLRRITTLVILFSVLVINLTAAGQKSESNFDVPTGLKSALESIESENLLAHAKTLASDEFEGRAPGTRGEQQTIQYLANHFRVAGLRPGNPDGSFFQAVPMVGYKTIPQIALTIDRKAAQFKFLEDFIHDLPRLQKNVKVKVSDVIFAGYGIVAPQYGWDDYKDADVQNKLVLVLSGEPSRPDATDTKKLDATFFRGDTRTYYSTREAKYAQAAKRGAAGILVITDPEKALTFSIFKTFAQMEGMALKTSAASYWPAIAGLVTKKAVDRFVALAGINASELEKSAQNKDFKVISLKAKGAISITSKIRHFTSKNVVAKVEGSDPRLKNEYVIYSAHWDHLGKDTSLVGDQIYNGANDNAAGTAQLLEMARGFAALKAKPRRSVLFIATTGEEKGYLGSRFYAQNPLYPIKDSVAAINLDAGNPFGRTKDLGSAGFGNSTLDDVLARAAKMQGRIFLKESLDGDGGYYFASDQIEFAKVGIPAVFPWSGFDYVGKPADYGEKKWDEYGKKRYHRVTDEVMPDWDMSGAVEDARWMMIAGYLVADEVKRPAWLPGTEFKR